MSGIQKSYFCAISSYSSFDERNLTYLMFSNIFTHSAPLGSIPELPARSCREIKASEGKATGSNKYWLDPSSTGKAVLVYCDMYLEGKS